MQKASFVDVFRASEKLHDGKVLKDLVSQNNSLQTKILNRSNSIITEKGHDSGTLSQNNALRWTHTTFAKAYTERNSYSSYEGRLSASLSISITPGQRPRFIDCLDKVLSEESGDIYPKETWDLQKHVHQFGTDDLIIKTVTHDANKIIPWADEFREKILELETTLPNRIIQGITIKISHESILEGEIVNTYSVIEPCLSSLKKDTFTKEGALFNLEKLKKSLTYFGVPIPLRRSLVYLYQDYANLLSNPQLFDLVIDLYDSFLTLYKVITNEDGELNDHTHTYNRENGKELQREILLNEAVNFLSQKVEALHNSFSNRANNAYPEEAVRDLSVLFQGQLSQVLSAADAPLKCGVGVLRRNSRGGKASDYQKVGVSVKIGFTKGVAVTTMPKSLKVTGDCSRRSTLAFVQIDVPHLLHVATYCDYLHEAFHLVCNSWIESDAGIGVEKFSKLSNFNQDRYEELLVHLLTCLFIAADDPETYILYYLTQVSNNSLLLSSDSKMVAARWVEECLRFYTISWLINKGVVKNDSFLKESIFNELSGIEATKFYSEFVDGFKEFFAQKLYIHCELVNYPDENRGKLEKFAQEAALQFIVSMFSSLESIWTCCYETIGRFEADELRQDTESKDATGSTLILTKVELASRVDGELKDGKPLSCALYDPERVYSRDKVAPDIGINPMLVMCAQIYSYIKRNQTSDPECSHHLRRVRQPDDSFKNVLDPGKPPADFLQDISSPSMFCCIPNLREERLKQQIAIIKTMWDISSSIKARRLAHLLGLEDDL